MLTVLLEYKSILGMHGLGAVTSIPYKEIMLQRSVRVGGNEAGAICN